jgi:hypothetical protein
MPARAGGFTYSDWIGQSPEWQQGYAFAIADYLTSIVRKIEAPNYASTRGYKRCFENKVNGAGLVAIINNYVQRTPEAATEPFVVVALRAFHETCTSYLPKQQAGS